MTTKPKKLLIIKRVSHNNCQLGFTITELMVVIAIALILTGLGVYNLKTLSDPLQNSSNRMLGFVKQIKARAVYTSSAYRIHALDNKTLTTSTAKTCNASIFTDDLTFNLDSAEDPVITTTGWTICFSSRGIADTSQRITLISTSGESKIIEIFKGGAVRLL